jgi:hypothetical protein
MSEHALTSDHGGSPTDDEGTEMRRITHGSMIDGRLSVDVDKRFSLIVRTVGLIVPWAISLN